MTSNFYLLWNVVWYIYKFSFGVRSQHVPNSSKHLVRPMTMGVLPS